MTASHKPIVQAFIDLLNSLQWNQVGDFVKEHFTEDFAFVLETWIERGLSVHKVDGRAVVERYPFGGSPVEGKLLNGDEILSVREGGRLIEDLDEITYGNWGTTLAEPVHLQARRDGTPFEVDFTPVLTRKALWPYPLEMWRAEYETNPDQLSEFHYNLDYLVEEGDTIACITSVTGLDKKFNRFCAFSQALVFEFQGERIARIFEVHNTANEAWQQGHRIIPPGG